MRTAEFANRALSAFSKDFTRSSDFLKLTFERFYI